MTITDFVTQREFERTGLYNEVWRPYNIRFEWAIPLELRGNVVVVTRTVQKHVQNIFNKLGVETRTAAALVALENCGKADSIAMRRTGAGRDRILREIATAPS
jgi:hypothetical protein